jgi:hypothetical protein
MNDDVFLALGSVLIGGPVQKKKHYAPRLNLSMQIHSYMFEECVPIIF